MKHPEGNESLTRVSLAPIVPAISIAGTQLATVQHHLADIMGIMHC